MTLRLCDSGQLWLAGHVSCPFHRILDKEKAEKIFKKMYSHRDGADKRMLSENQNRLTVLPGGSPGHYYKDRVLTTHFLI